MTGVDTPLSSVVAGGGKGEAPHLCRMGKESGVFCSDRPRGGGATLFLQRRLDQNLTHRLHRARVPPHHRCGGVGVHVRALPTGEESRLITQRGNHGIQVFAAGLVGKESYLITGMWQAGVWPKPAQEGDTPPCPCNKVEEVLVHPLSLQGRDAHFWRQSWRTEFLLQTPSCSTHRGRGGSRGFSRCSGSKEFSVPLFVTQWAAACQAPLSMGILQARALEWVAMPCSRGSSQPRDQTHVSHIAGGFFTNWAIREAQSNVKKKQIRPKVSILLDCPFLSPLCEREQVFGEAMFCLHPLAFLASPNPAGLHRIQGEKKIQIRHHFWVVLALLEKKNVQCELSVTFWGCKMRTTI